ncbi:MAG: hypothetical protein VYC68_02240, partial [Candidatus Thermoplasmatota archaeon]|nr:hypothetical protein [Candidatus Thermoplasmatota archaeon]
MLAGDPHGQPIATLWWGGHIDRLHLDAILGDGHSGLAESLALFFAMAVARCAPVFIRHVRVVLDQTGWANTWRRRAGPCSRNPTTTAVHALAASVVQKVAWGFDTLEVDHKLSYQLDGGWAPHWDANEGRRVLDDEIFGDTYIIATDLAEAV